MVSLEAFLDECFEMGSPTRIHVDHAGGLGKLTRIFPKAAFQV